MPAASITPASPASAPETAKTVSVSRASEKPAKRAARGAWPTRRISKPLSVRAITTAATATTTSAMTLPRFIRPPSKRSGSVASGAKVTVWGMLKPIGSRQGPRTR